MGYIRRLMMGFFNVDKAVSKPKPRARRARARKGNIGKVYIFKLILADDTVVYKIGITTRSKIEDRLGEVLMTFFTKYRYVPRTTVKKFKACEGHLDKEKKLHKMYADYKYIFDKKFSGSTEFFRIEDEKMLVKNYDNVLSDI